MTRTPNLVEQLLERTVADGASDLHLSTAVPPRIRVDGKLLTLDLPPLTGDELWGWLDGLLDDKHRRMLEEHGDVDFGFDAVGGRRFRMSIYRERGRDTVAIRHLSARIPTMDEIGLPAAAREWTSHQNGLIIVTGPTGSGKSTTIASMVNSVNESRPEHVITIEDPVEYVYPPAYGLIRQREVGTDASEFARAVRASLREDADIVVLGEMRDLETIASAITVSETGHLVFATLHTASAASAVDRIINAFETDEQPLIRSRLASSLIGVIYQRLLPQVGGGRVAAFEVLVANYAIKNLIREGKTFQIPNMMQTGANIGMQSMAAALTELQRQSKLTEQQVADFLDQNRD